MIRYVACLKCNSEFKLCNEDAEDGWHFRARTGILKQQGKDFGITIQAGGQSTFIPSTEVVCDFCNCVLPVGKEIAAITMWRESEEKPEDWETDYITVFSSPI
jgi:hypothetical protein